MIKSRILLEKGCWMIQVFIYFVGFFVVGVFSGVYLAKTLDADIDEFEDLLNVSAMGLAIGIFWPLSLIVFSFGFLIKFIYNKLVTE